MLSMLCFHVCVMLDAVHNTAPKGDTSAGTRYSWNMLELYQDREQPYMSIQNYISEMMTLHA